MSVPIAIVLDCYDPATLAEFWAEAMQYTIRGGTPNGQYVMLRPAEGDGPKLILQKVSEDKTVKNRMHIDVHTSDIEAEAKRLEGLGAARLDPEPIEEWETAWIRMSDPQGNEFCVCRG